MDDRNRIRIQNQLKVGSGSKKIIPDPRHCWRQSEKGENGGYGIAQKLPEQRRDWILTQPDATGKQYLNKGWRLINRKK
jgi:hypothetical protein